MCATASGACAGRLPDEIEEPIIQKVEADAQPILYLAFFSDRHSELEITDYADRYVKDQLQTLSGVAEVRSVRRARIFHAHLARSRAPRRLPV